MSNTTIEQKPRIDLYWRAWLGIVGFAVLLRLVTLLVFGHAHPSYIGMVYAAGTWMSLMVLSSIQGRRLRSYLKEHHYGTWEKITHVPFFGPGGSNTFRGLSWLDSSDGMDDPILASMKREARSRIRLMLTVFCTFPILVPLLSI